MYQDWTKEDVAYWLENTVKLQQHVITFLDIEVDGKSLDLIDDKDLEDFGINLKFHRKKILDGIE